MNTSKHKNKNGKNSKNKRCNLEIIIECDSCPPSPPRWLTININSTMNPHYIQYIGQPFECDVEVINPNNQIIDGPIKVTGRKYYLDQSNNRIPNLVKEYTQYINNDLMPGEKAIVVFKDICTEQDLQYRGFIIISQAQTVERVNLKQNNSTNLLNPGTSPVSEAIMDNISGSPNFIIDMAKLFQQNPEIPSDLSFKLADNSFQSNPDYQVWFVVYDSIGWTISVIQGPKPHDVISPENGSGKAYLIKNQDEIYFGFRHTFQSGFPPFIEIRNINVSSSDSPLTGSLIYSFVYDYGDGGRFFKIIYDSPDPSMVSSSYIDYLASGGVTKEDCIKDNYGQLSTGLATRIFNVKSATTFPNQCGFKTGCDWNDLNFRVGPVSQLITTRRLIIYITCSKPVVNSKKKIGDETNNKCQCQNSSKQKSNTGLIIKREVIGKI